MIGYYKALNGACFVLPEAQGSFIEPASSCFLPVLRLFRPVPDSLRCLVSIPFSACKVAPRPGPARSGSFVFPG